MLVDRHSGLPLFDPTVFTLTECRARNLASATIEQVLRSLMVFHLYLDLHRIALQERLIEGRLLDLGEIDDLVRFCRKPLNTLDADPDSPRVLSAESVTVTSIEKFRMRAKVMQPEVGGKSAAIRIHYIRDYLRWIVDRHLLGFGRRQDDCATLERTRDAVLSAIDARIPTGKGRNATNQREGISPEALAHLVAVIEPNSPDNPWVGRHARERNALIIHWFIALGLRRGELLGIRISDIDFRANQVLIARRADDKNDPRRNQPNTKTNDRIVPLGDDLARRTREYIFGARRAFADARKKHDFVIVANGRGRPLTLIALNKIFDALRRKCPELPSALGPHLLRHTWNDSFSDVMDKQGVKEDDEKKMRSTLMGWKPTSDTAATYTRRTTKRRARKASLELQEGMVKPKLNEK